MSASCEELRSALRESLEAQGVLGEMRAKLRAEIFRLIDASGDVARPDMPPETAVVAELCREFLAFSGYSQTLSVFEAEAGLSSAEKSLSRDIIAADLGIRQAPSSKTEDLPLLYNLVQALKHTKADRLLSHK